MRWLRQPDRVCAKGTISMMNNRLTTIVFAGLLGLGAVGAAQASHRHERASSEVRYASLGGSYCTDRPWSCEASPVRQEMSHAARRGHRGYAHASGHGVSASDLIGTLQSKVSEIVSACGARLVSGYRPGARVAGSGHPSLHSVYPARAADMSGNPSCIYSHLQGWQGGYSIDYGRVRHVHISYSPPGGGDLAGREWHARFAHYAGGHNRYARRHHHRLAMR
jgi:hypothetical protein